MRAFVALLALPLLAGCVTAQGSAPGGARHADRDVLATAGGGGPILVEAARSPTGDDQTAAAAIAMDASSSLRGVAAVFTADRSAVRRPETRLVALFDVPASVPTVKLCGADWRDLPRAGEADRTRLNMAFCEGEQEHAGVILGGPALTGIDDPALSEMVWTGMNTMFRERRIPTGGR